MADNVDKGEYSAGMYGAMLLLVQLPGGHKPSKGPRRIKVQRLKKKKDVKKSKPLKACGNLDEDDEGGREEQAGEAEDDGEDRRAAMEHDYDEDSRVTKDAEDKEDQGEAETAEDKEDEDEYDSDEKDQGDEENVIRYEENKPQGKRK